MAQYIAPTPEEGSYDAKVDSQIIPLKPFYKNEEKADDGLLVTKPEGDSVGSGVNSPSVFNTSTYNTISATAPGGSDTHVQFNDAGNFGGDASLTYNKTTDILSLETINNISGNDLALATIAAVTPNDISITGGSASSGSNNGGDITVTGGTAGSSGGRGGNITVNAGDGNTNTDTDGGDITISAGDAKFTGAAGRLTLRGGAAGTTGTPDDVYIFGGDAGSTSGPGGAITLKAGDAVAGNSNGGNITVTPGIKKGSGDEGTFRILNPTPGSIAASFDTARLGINRSYAFPADGGLFGVYKGGIVSSEFTVSGATLTDVTLLSAIFTTQSSPYLFDATLFIDADVVGGSQFAVNYTGTTNNIIYEIAFLDNATNTYTITSRQITSGGAAGQAGTTAGICHITGYLNGGSDGTLTVQFAQNAANGTSSVLTGSSFKVYKLP